MGQSQSRHSSRSPQSRSSTYVVTTSQPTSQSTSPNLVEDAHRVMKPRKPQKPIITKEILEWLYSRFNSMESSNNESSSSDSDSSDSDDDFDYW